jgi:hypothetical protein
VPLTLVHRKFEINVAVEFAEYSPGGNVPRFVFCKFKACMSIKLGIQLWIHAYLVKVYTGCKDRESNVENFNIAPRDLQIHELSTL